MEGERERFEVSVTAMVTLATAAAINRLAHEKQVSRADVLREIIRLGLPDLLEHEATKKHVEDAKHDPDDPYRPGWHKRAMEQVSSL